MKWIKLDCDFLDDPKIQRLIAEIGFEAAVSLWTGLLALVGRYGKDDCCLDLSDTGEWTPEVLAKRLFCRYSVLEARLKLLARLNLISQIALDEQVIAVPNMMKRRDEYSKKKARKSAQRPESVRTLSGECPEKSAVDIDKNRLDKKHIPSSAPNGAGTDAGFDRFWSAYPKKREKLEAQKVWNRIHPRNGLVETIIAAVEAAKRSPDWLKENGQYIPNPAKWLRRGNWEDDIRQSLLGRMPDKPEPVC